MTTAIVIVVPVECFAPQCGHVVALSAICFLQVLQVFMGGTVYVLGLHYTSRVESVDYKPSAYYYRRALRMSRSRRSAVLVGMCVIRELEMLKAWIRAEGMVPPKRYVMTDEAREKAWAPPDR